MRRTIGGLLLVLMLAAACGEDDGASVRSSGTASGSGSGSASGSASGSVVSGSSSGTGHASGPAGCEEVGAGRLADNEVHVELDEWRVTPDAESVDAGAIEFELTNAGEDEHEFAVTRADSADDLPLAEDDTVDIPALEDDGSFVGEVEAFPAGGECSGVFDLEPGRYVLFCNLIHEEEEGVENHFQEGMATEFVVRG